MDKEFEMFAEVLCYVWENQTDDVEVDLNHTLRVLKRRALLTRRPQPT